MPRMVLTGNHAVSYAVKLARVQVIAIYPITPQTAIVEKLDEMIESGEFDADIIHVESEHSALAAAYGAAVGGARVFTATSSHGLLYMYEVLWWVAASRMPMVMVVVTRAIGPPWNIHTDHHDIMSMRDSGWLLAMAENNQEALDLTLLAYRVSEDPRVYLPVAVGLDGFILSHTAEPVDVPEQSIVDRFLPERRQPYTIEPGTDVSMGNIFSDEYFEELRMDMQKSMLEALNVIREAGREYGRLTGRSYEKLVDCYKCEDADYLFIGIGSWMGDAKIAAEKLREEGLKFGVARLRWIRPFPVDELLEAASGKKLLVVMDRSISMGHTGPLYADVSGATGSRVPVYGVVAGIGGVDVSYKDFVSIGKWAVERLEEEGVTHLPLTWYHNGVFNYMYPVKL
ncbi:MAG TPA: pyruvate ferredoxin oxidoreductase [Pyrodictium sp.]|nr:pyruvate ferredoxin oxidoreductase [Pyrodictium sp.]